MKTRNFLAAILVFSFAFTPFAYAGETDLMSFYPPQYGEYTTLYSQSASNFATSTVAVGNNIGIGVPLTLPNTSPRDNGLTSGSDLDISGVIIQEAWVNASGFANSWVTYGAPFDTAGYRRDKNGIVALRGAIKNGTAVPSIAFTIGAGGYRPAATELQTCYSSTFCRIEISSAGVVTVVSGTNPLVVLDGITFRASGY